MKRHATCMLCEANCGLEVEVEGDRLKIRGDKNDPWSRGYMCPKAVALGEISADPDRIRTPLRRRGDRWLPISWDEALDEAAYRLADVQRRHGRDAVALYLGNPVAHSYSGMLASMGLISVLATRNRYTANSVDGHPRVLTSLLLYGSPFAMPIPDVDRTDFLLVIGANPIVSNGSILTAPDCKRRLAAIRARGGTIVVIDPRRTETAEIADRHHFIAPGTDALLLAALIRTILDENLARPIALSGLDRVSLALAAFTPERVAPVVGIVAPAIRALARDFAGARSAACYGRMGTCTQELGTLATWLCDVLAAITGNLDRPGGSMFPSPAIDLATIGRALVGIGAAGHHRYTSRVRGLPELAGELPVATLADEIETPGPGQIRALITYAGNPVLSCPNGSRIDRAIAQLEFRVAIDIYRNETTRHADLLLPTSFGLEHEHHPLLHHALAARNGFKYSPAVLAPPPGVRHDWQVVLGLTARLASRGGLASRMLGRVLRRAAASEGLPRKFLELAVKLGPRRTEVRDIDAPHGTDLGPLVPRLRGPIDIAPRVILDDIPRLTAVLERARPDELVLIGRRHLRSNNSWMHNNTRLVAGRKRCTLMVHPDDAQARGLADGDLVHARSRVGTIELPIETSDAVMPGVACMPHGWGHDRDGAQRVAAANAGASMNDLTDDAVVDVPSGCAVLTGVRITIEPAQRTSSRAAHSDQPARNGTSTPSRAG